MFAANETSQTLAAPIGIPITICSFLYHVTPIQFFLKSCKVLKCTGILRTHHINIYQLGLTFFTVIWENNVAAGSNRLILFQLDIINALPQDAFLHLTCHPILIMEIDVAVILAVGSDDIHLVVTCLHSNKNSCHIAERTTQFTDCCKPLGNLARDKCPWRCTEHICGISCILYLMLKEKAIPVLNKSNLE